jgi:GTP-binding protein EngB required for normal cell division
MDLAKLLDNDYNEEEKEQEEIEEFEIELDDQEESFEVISTNQDSVCTQPRDDFEQQISSLMKSVETKKREIVFVVFFGHVNSGKSSLIKCLSAKQTKITLQGNYNVSDIDYYCNDRQPNIIFTDTAGFTIGKQSGSTRIDMENFVDDLTVTVKKNFLLLRPDVDENSTFKFVYALIESNGNLSKHYIYTIDYLNKSKKLWFLLISKIDTRISDLENESEKLAFIEKKRKEILMQLRCIPKEVINRKLYFISVCTKYYNCAWNELKKFKIKFENASYLLYDECMDFYNNYELDIDINIGVFGGGNIGKSSLVKLITNDNRIKVSDGVTTKQIECYDHPEYSIVHFYDTPGDDGLDVTVDIENATHAFDVIILLVNDSVTEADLQLVRDINENNKNKRKKIKLFVLKTFFDVDYRNKINIEMAKLLHQNSILRQLEASIDTPFYCVSLSSKYRKMSFNDDLERFLNDWFQIGLTDTQKEDCLNTSSKSHITEEYLTKMTNQMHANINKMMAGSFFWNFIPILGTVIDKAYIKKFIKRYAILLKLHANGNKLVDKHYDSILRRRFDSRLSRIREIRKKYEQLDSACDHIYHEALENFGQKFPSFKSITTLFRFDSPITISLKSFADISIKTITSLLVTLMDDIAKVLPKALPKFGPICGLVGLGLSLVFCFTAVLHIYLLTKEIPTILLNDAKIIYSIRN